MDPHVLQPYLTAINTVISLSVLGLVFNLIKIHRETVNERMGVLKERLDALKDFNDQAEKLRLAQSSLILAEKKTLENELDKLRQQLNSVLEEEGFTLDRFVIDSSLRIKKGHSNKLIEELSTNIASKVEALTNQMQPPDDIVRQTQLTLATAQMAKGDFTQAAAAFQEYTLNENASWEVHFSKGVSLANARSGSGTDLASVKAYGDALSALPKEIDPNIRARVFCYRGAILKRLGRLDEAEADLNIAKSIATAAYEVDDIAYNLSCVYAMQGKKAKMILTMNTIQNTRNIKKINSHAGDYFAQFENDPDFRDLLDRKLRV